MADTHLARRVLAVEHDQRKQELTKPHPIYSNLLHQWVIRLDAYEGSGGFLDGSYLWKYRREDAADYAARQANARYHNFAKAIVNLYARYVFGRGVTRSTLDQGLMDWWGDVDQSGTPIDDFMVRALKLALAAGHEGILMDKTPTPSEGPSLADERSAPFLTLYQPTSILDWRLDQNELVAVKLLETAPQTDILAFGESEDVLFWDTDEWARFTQDGQLVDRDGAEGVHGLGVVPFVLLRPDPSALHPFVGLSLLGDGQVFKAIYNRCSEEDEVLRTQGFSTFVVSVQNAEDVQRIKDSFPEEMGTGRAIITAGSADFRTPDQAVPGAIRENISWLIRELYRGAHIRFSRDSLVAESGEAIRLQHSDLTQALIGAAQECQRVDAYLAWLYFRWTHASPQEADTAFERAQVNIEYPTEFFVRDLVEELGELAEEVAANFGPTFVAAEKKRLTRRIRPDLDEVTRAQVDVEIDRQTPFALTETVES